MCGECVFVFTWCVCVACLYMWSMCVSVEYMCVCVCLPPRVAVLSSWDGGGGLGGPQKVLVSQKTGEHQRTNQGDKSP